MDSQQLFHDLSMAVLESSGDTSTQLRQTIHGHATHISQTPLPEPGSTDNPQLTTPAPSDIPPALLSWVEQIVRYSYKTTEQDIDTLQADGYSEDAIFEVTVAAALGAGTARAQRALAALNEALDELNK